MLYFYQIKTKEPKGEVYATIRQFFLYFSCASQKLNFRFDENKILFLFPSGKE